MTRPSTGRSVPLTTSGNAMSGVAVSTAVALAEARPGRPATRNAARLAAANASPAHSRGSVSRPGPKTACGSPNTVMTGRYGL